MKHPRSGEFAAHNGTHCSYRMFDRHGGVSTGLYASLNVGDHVGDQEEAVQENRRKVREDSGGFPSTFGKTGSWYRNILFNRAVGRR